MKMENLEKCFNAAIEKDVNYVGVLIQMQGFKTPEIIINETPNFKAKLEYYQKAYDSDLTLKTFNGIKIIGFTYANTFTGIKEALLGNEK